MDSRSEDTRSLLLERLIDLARSVTRNVDAWTIEMTSDGRTVYRLQPSGTVITVETPQAAMDLAKV